MSELEFPVHVEQGEAYHVALDLEPFPYTRINHASRWKLPAGSPGKRYLDWMGEFRILYKTLGYYREPVGLPFFEPLSVSGAFRVTSGWDQKDLDNLIKGTIDALNPKTSKGQTELFLWADDKQIKRFGSWQTVLGSRGEISLAVTPLWSRLALGIPMCRGGLREDGLGHRIFSTEGFEFPVRIFRPNPVLGTPRNYLLWPELVDGAYPAFLSFYDWTLYREGMRTGGVSQAMLAALLGSPDPADARESIRGPILYCPPGVSMTRAKTAWQKLAARFAPYEYDLRAYLEDRIRTDSPTVLIELTRKIADVTRQPWRQVHRWLSLQDLDASRTLEALLAQYLPFCPTWKSDAPKKKASSKVKRP